MDRVQSLLAGIAGEPIRALAVVLAVPIKAHPTVLTRCRLALICRIAGIALLVVIHGTEASMQSETRRYHDTAGFLRRVSTAEFRTNWCREPPCRPLRLVRRAMDGLSYCEQALRQTRT